MGQNKHRHLADTARRRRALARLQTQLQKGTKRKKLKEVELTEKDRKRIVREITVLEQRIAEYS